MTMGRLERALIPAVVAAVLVGTAGTAFAGTARPASTRDYLIPRVMTSGAEQCAKPVTARTGNWTCLAGSEEQRRARQRVDARRANAAVRPMEGSCTAEACWNVYSSIDSDFSSAGIFGYGGEELGQVDVYYEVVLNGAQSVSRPVWFTPTTGVSSLTIEGERLYYSDAHPEGHPVSPSTYSFYTTGPVNADVTASWAPNGYKAYENTVQHGSVVHQWTWTMAEFPGNWYIYGKSVKFDMTSSSYRFGSSTYIGQDAVGAGWHESLT